MWERDTSEVASTCVAGAVAAQTMVHLFDRALESASEGTPSAMFFSPSTPYCVYINFAVLQLEDSRIVIVPYAGSTYAAKVRRPPSPSADHTTRVQLTAT